MSIVETYFKSRQEARDWLDFDCDDDEMERVAFDENDRFAEWQMWRNTTRHFYTEDAVRDIARAALTRNSMNMLLSGHIESFEDSLDKELDERAAALVLAPLPE